jgi:hypothetical protein
MAPQRRREKNLDTDYTDYHKSFDRQDAKNFNRREVQKAEESKAVKNIQHRTLNIERPMKGRDTCHLPAGWKSRNAGRINTDFLTAEARRRGEKF